MGILTYLKKITFNIVCLPFLLKELFFKTNLLFMLSRYHLQQKPEVGGKFFLLKFFCKHSLIIVYTQNLEKGYKISTTTQDAIE